MDDVTLDPDRLPALVERFVDRMFADFIVGFLFEGRDRDRIVRHELELARKHLFGVGGYTGRPIGPLHRALKLNRGHFRRRLAVLRTVLREEGVPEPVIARWITHDAALEGALTDGTDCVPEEAG